MNYLSSNKAPHDFYHKEMLDFAKGLSCIGHVISIFAFIYAVNYIYSFPYVPLEWSNVTMTNIFLIQKIWNYLIYFTLLLCISDILSYILFFISFIFVVTLSSLVSGQYWLCKSLEASLSFLLWKKICTGVNFFGDIIKFFSEIIWHWRILVVRIFIIAFFFQDRFLFLPLAVLEPALLTRQSSNSETLLLLPSKVLVLKACASIAHLTLVSRSLTVLVTK